MEELTKFADDELHYSFAVPTAFAQYGWKEKMAIGGKTVHSLWNGIFDKSGATAIDIFHLPEPKSCARIGISKPVSNEKINSYQLIWGEVDYRFQTDPADTDEEAKGLHCYPVAPVTAAYALCSEKDGKTVLICITQVTDNPALAKQIFETFRWTD